MVFLMPIAMLKAVPNGKSSLSMSFYFIIKTSSRFNGFYRNPAGLPSFTPARLAPTRVAPTSVAPARVAAELGLPLAGLPRQGCSQGDIALPGLPRQGSTPPHVAYSGIVHLLCDGPAHLVLLARWRGFVVLLYEVLFSCRAGLQVPYGPRMLAPAKVGRPRHGCRPPGLPPAGPCAGGVGGAC